MMVKRISPLSGKTNTLDLPITHEQYEAWRHGALIQDAMPNLTDGEREFIMSGMTETEFDEAFGDEDE